MTNTPKAQWLAVFLLVTMGMNTLGRQATITQAPFGPLDEKTNVTLFTLTNTKGSSVSITDYGGIIVSLKIPDRNGTLGNIVTGHDSVAGYLTGNPYSGSIIGRVANRITGGRFTIDGTEYILTKNQPPHHLHGGEKGFHKAVWKATASLTNQGPSLEMHLASPDGNEGYPGTLKVTATYTLTNENELKLNFKATTDKATHCNLTSHSYFNLSAFENKDVLDHVFTFNASHYTPINATRMPTGEIATVAGTAFDFTKPMALKDQINRRFDHNMVVDREAEDLALHATVECPLTGRTMEVYSTDPGFQFFTGNQKTFCIEPQKFPDAANQPDFPSTLLRPGETYEHRITYRFGTR